MAITKYNGINWADITSINGIARASIAKVNANSPPAAAGNTATKMVAAIENNKYAYASTTALSGNTNWTPRSSRSAGGAKPFDIGFGKDGSGNGIFIITRANSTRELEISSTDVTADADWTFVDISSDLGQRNQIVVMWGARSDGNVAGTWMACGDQSGKRIHRSTDGAANWTNVDLSGITGHDAARDIQSIASDGDGNWAFAQENRFYFSDDDGASFTSSPPWGAQNSTNEGGGPGQVRGFLYTNNSWIVIYSRSSQIYVRSCAKADITDWGTEHRPTIQYNQNTADGSGTVTDTVYAKNPTNTLDQRASSMAANGRVVLATTGDDAIFYFDVDGKTISNGGGKYFKVDNTYEGVAGWNNSNTIQDIATDGANNWVAACDNGDAYISDDNGVTWSQMCQGYDEGDVASTNDWKAICADVTFPIG